MYMVKFVSADGRAFTSYNASCLDNRDIRESQGITSNYNYRMYLQRNAEKLMEQDRSFAFQKNKLDCNCPQCKRIASFRN